MKQILVPAALALAAAACCAQSSVTVYGVVDAAVTQVSGLRGGKVRQLASGMMDGSRLGFRGNEDLGGGWRALFTMESRLELDNGGITNRPPSLSQVPDRLSQAALLGLPPTLQPVVSAVSGSIGNGIGVNLPGALWDRQIYAGLVTPYGALLAGRQYTPAYEASASFDTLGTQSALAFGQVGSIPAAIDIRVSNALAYRVQTGPFTASAMVAAGEGSTTTGRLVGAMAMYKTDAFGLGVGYNERKNEREAKSLRSLVLGASAGVGPGTAFAQYIKIKDDNPTGTAGIAALVQPSVGATLAGVVQTAFVNALKQDANGMHVGYRLVSGVNTVYVAWSRYDDKRPNNADTTSYGVTYSYALSKRTDINANVTRFVNSGLAQAAPGQAGSLGGVTSAAGVDSTSMALGLRHRF